MVKFLACLATSLCLLASPLLAQQPAPESAQATAASRPAIEEIVVTAEKRVSTVQATPIAITALTSE